MATFKVENVRIAGVSACIPKNKIENKNSQLFDTEEEKQKYIEMVGVDTRYVTDENTCSSDLCFASAEKLLSDLDWNREEIDCLVFVTKHLIINTLQQHVFFKLVLDCLCHAWHSTCR